MFSSPYPLWILLAINGAVVAIAGTTSAFVSDPGPAFADEAEFVRVPRDEWESLRGRAEHFPRSGGPARDAPDLPGWSTPEGFFSELTSGPAAASPASDPTKRLLPESLRAPDVDSSPLRRDVALLELRGIAEGAISLGENLGVEELHTLLEASSDDLSRISRLLDAARAPRESPSELLLRLLQLPPTTPAHPPGEPLATDPGKLVERLVAIMPPSTDSRPPAIPPASIGGAADEVDELLRELEPRRERRRTK